MTRTILGFESIPYCQHLLNVCLRFECNHSMELILYKKRRQHPNQKNNNRCQWNEVRWMNESVINWCSNSIGMFVCCHQVMNVSNINYLASISLLVGQKQKKIVSLTSNVVKSTANGMFDRHRTQQQQQHKSHQLAIPSVHLSSLMFVSIINFTFAILLYSLLTSARLIAFERLYRLTS